MGGMEADFLVTIERVSERRMLEWPFKAGSPRGLKPAGRCATTSNPLTCIAAALALMWSCLICGDALAAPAVETAYIPAADVQPDGPVHPYRISVFEITNEQFAGFLNDAIENLGNERGFYLLFDSSSGDVYVNSSQTGSVDVGETDTLVFDSENNLDLTFDSESSQYEVAAGKENHPVTGVSWFGAVKFCNWLTIDQGLSLDDRIYLEATNANLAGWRPVTSADDETWAARDLNDDERAALIALRGFRLPMDDGSDGASLYNEWYKAAAWNGAGNNQYGFGADPQPIDGSFANYVGSGDPFDNGTTPVGFFGVDGLRLQDDPVFGWSDVTIESFAVRDTQNRYGLHDMSGNVWEWMQDHGLSGDARRNRGGSWRSVSQTLVASLGTSRAYDAANDSTGFRIVQSATQPLLVTPQDGLAVSGVWGGPYGDGESLSITYDLANLSDTAISVRVQSPATWINFLDEQGLPLVGDPAIPASSDVEVTVEIAPECADQLSVGLNVATVEFVDLSDGSRTERSVQLSITEPLTVLPADLFRADIDWGGSPAATSYAITSLSDSSVEVSVSWQDTTASPSGVEWLELNGVTAPSGLSLSIDPTSSVVLDVTIDPAGLDAGTHTATILIVDDCTGSEFSRVIELVIKAPLTVTPGAAVTFAGVQGGPFDPLKHVFVVASAQDDPLTWQIRVESEPVGTPVDWLTVTPLSGTLDMLDDEEDVTIEPSAAADSLAVGTYEARVIFEDPVSGFSETRSVTLEVSELDVTPTSDAVFSGLLGGPFSPVAETYTLRNTGLDELAWTATFVDTTLPPAGEIWLDVSPAAGVILESDGSQEVILTLSPAVSQLATGEYTGSITFTSLSTGGTATRLVTLSVGTEGFSLPMVAIAPEQIQPSGPEYRYRIGRFEVTNEEFVDFLNDALLNIGDDRGAFLDHDTAAMVVRLTGDGTVIFDATVGEAITFADGSYSSMADTSRLPVVGVSWFGAVKFCNWLTLAQGMDAVERVYLEGATAGDWLPDGAAADVVAKLGFRLPMDQAMIEAGQYNEWFKAAAWLDAQVINAAYGFGRETLTDVDANYLDSGDPFEPGPSPVGWFDGLNSLEDAGTTADTENAYGLYDVTGNVAEWTHDVGLVQGERGVRGGHFNNVATSALLRTDARGSWPAESTLSFVGFRVAQTVESPTVAIGQPAGEASRVTGFVGGPFDFHDGDGLRQFFTLQILHPGGQTIDDLGISIAPAWLEIEGVSPSQIPPGRTVEVRLKVADAAISAGVSPKPAGDFVLVPADDALAGGPEYDFWIGRTEITNQDFADFLNDARADILSDAPDTRSEYLFFDDDTGSVLINSQVDGQIGSDAAGAGLTTMLYDAGVGRVKLVYDADLDDDVYVVECDVLTDCPSFCSGGLHDGLACVSAVDCPSGTCDLAGDWYDDHPVVGVSWYGAIKYSNWRTVSEGISPALRAFDESTADNLAGWHPVVVDDATWLASGLSDAARVLLVQDTLGYRLPMDGGGAGASAYAEWFKAASRGGRASTGEPIFGSVFGYGRDEAPLSADANFLAGGALLADGTTPVRFFDGSRELTRKPPLNCSVPVSDAVTTRDTDNGYAVYDATGNAAEWCLDFFDDARTDVVTRGGSWQDAADSVLLTTGARRPLAPGSVTGDTGIRLVRGTGHVVTVTVTDALSATSLQRPFILDLREPFLVAPAVDFEGPTQAYAQPIPPSETSYTLTNRSASAMEWSASTDVNWLDLVEPVGGELSGTIEAGEVLTFDLSTNDNINLLGPGTHRGDTTIRNVTTGQQQSRLFVLTIDQPIAYLALDADPQSFSLVWGESPDALSGRRFDLSNLADIDLDFLVAINQPWLTVEPVDVAGALSGRIEALETISFEVTANDGASALDVGQYTATLSFSFDDTLNDNVTGAIQQELTVDILSPITIDVEASVAWIVGALDPNSLPSQVYTLTNNSSNAIEVAISIDQDWLDVDVSVLEILPGLLEQRTVTVSIKQAALDLPNGDYQATLMIDDPLVGEIHCRSIELTVDEPLSVSPPSDFNTAGVAGTRVVPINKVYTLTNNARPAAVPIDWDASVSTPGANWVLVNGASSTSGSLPVGATATVVVAIDLAATSSLAAGTYTAEITIRDLTNGTSRVRAVSLTLVVASFSFSEAPVPPIPGPASGPAYAFQAAAYKTTNAQFAMFLNDARANGADERGQFMYHDLDSGDVYINDKQLGEEGTVAPTGARTTLMYDASSGQILLSADTYAAEPGLENHPVTGVTWFGAVKYANWLTIDQGLPLEARCYLEADGTDINGWRPAVISEADWLLRDLDAAERQTLVSDYLGYRLPMDQGYNNVESSTDSPDAFNEWLKLASFDPTAPDQVRASPAGQAVAPFHWMYGFGADDISAGDANFRCSGDPFESTEDCLVAGATPVGFYDGTEYNPGGNGAVGNGDAFQTAPNGNFYDIFDAATNVREWLQGRFDTHPQSVLRRTIRGGSWRSPATSTSVEAVFRNLLPPGFASDEIGFRVVRSVVLGDTDSDGDVDEQDLATLIGCMNGPEPSALVSGCEIVDLNGDGSVDLVDLAIMQLLYSGGP